MIDIRMNESGDLLLEQSDFSLTKDKEDVLQSVRIILGTRLGEFFFDENMGLLRENLHDKPVNLDYVEQDIIEAITTQEPRIDSVDSVLFDFNKNTRNLRIGIKMTDIIGDDIELKEVSIDA